MSKLLCVCAFLLASVSAQADRCALPSADVGDPYPTLAEFSKREFHLLLNEYMFVHGWTRHAEAVSAGFRLGSRVYGEVLKAEGRFSTSGTAAWRRAYSKSGRPQFVAELGSKVDMATVDRAVIDWVLGVCLGSGLWSELRGINDCRFVFAAGLVTADPGTSTVQPLRFEVRGGRCARWPARPLSRQGESVQCVRSGSGAVSLELITDRAGPTRQTLSPLAQSALPPEPLQENKLSGPVSEVFTLWRSRDYRLQQLGRGCASCGLYAADIRPSAPGAVILRAATVSSSGGGWQACPAGFRCGVYEFSPPDDPRLSGCADQAVCRVWRLAETAAEASDVIQLTYQAAEVACVNCPDATDFQTAHRKWQELRAAAAPARCEVFADSPAQAIGPGPKK